MDAMSHVTWIPHPQELVKLHVYFTKTSLTKELYVENKSLHQLTQDHPSKQLLKMGTSSKMNILQSELFLSSMCSFNFDPNSIKVLSNKQLC